MFSPASGGPIGGGVPRRPRPPVDFAEVLRVAAVRRAARERLTRDGRASALRMIRDLAANPTQED